MWGVLAPAEESYVPPKTTQALFIIIYLHTIINVYNILMKNKVNKYLLHISVALIGVFFFPQLSLSAACGQQIGNTPSGFGSVRNFFGGGSMTSVDCSGDEVTISASMGQNQIVYRGGFYLDGSSWRQMRFEGGRALSDNPAYRPWASGESAATITPSSVRGNGYYIFFACTWANQKWNCGCANRQCSKPMWQIGRYSKVEEVEYPTDNSSSSGTYSPNCIPAFPGAEGWGRCVTGGRGGQIVYVTNLNDSGPGSWRAAATLNRPRIIIFKTGGTIRLRPRKVDIAPNATIFGQTAPGDGILITGAVTAVGENVIIRGMRFRPGDPPNAEEADGWDALKVRNDDVIIDRTSIGWGSDGALDITQKSNGGPVNNLTVQWSIISETLNCSKHPKGCHSYATLWGDNMRNTTLHHNLWNHNGARNPLVKGDHRQFEFINNVTTRNLSLGWNPSMLKSVSNDAKQVGHVIGNWIKPSKGIAIGDSPWGNRYPSNSKIYISGNVSESGRASDVVIGNKAFNNIVSNKPLFSPTGVTTQSANQAQRLVLQHAGATVPRRDAADKRAVNISSFRLIDSVSEVGGIPRFATGSYPTDSDKDGIPNSWETARGLNPNNAADATRLSPNKYMWIEEYANSLIQMP
jgi:pectate lyase